MSENNITLGNKASIDWRDIPDANGFTHWQYEEAKKNGVELKPPQRGEQEMTITAIPKNKKLVEAKDKLERIQTVDVGNNANFAIGDVVKVGPHESGFPDVWQLLSGVPQDRRRNVPPINNDDAKDFMENLNVTKLDPSE